MKKLYWVIIAIVTIILIAEGYALYKIPQTHFINGELTYQQETNIEPGTIFRLSLESRAQGANKFAIISASEQNPFSSFPQSFTLPVLKKSLLATGLYQLRVEVIKDNKRLFVNRDLLPLTRTDLNQDLNIELQLLPQLEIKRAAEPAPEVVLEKEASAVIEIEKVEPVKLDISALLANKKWLLNSKVKNKPHLTFDIQQKRAFGSGGCNDFQGGYQIDQSALVMQYLISTEKNCATGMELEDTFLDALAKVNGWAVKEGKLYLYDNNKAELLEFISQ